MNQALAATETAFSINAVNRPEAAINGIVGTAAFTAVATLAQIRINRNDPPSFSLLKTNCILNHSIPPKKGS